MRSAWISIVGCLLVGGCILEDNPAFVESGGTTSSEGSGGTVDTSAGPTGTTNTSVDTTMSGTGGSDDGSSSGGTFDPMGPGCNDLALCTTYHIGPVEGSCDREEDGVFTDQCDWVGAYSLRIAAATLEFDAEPGRIIMHDNNGVTASYVGGVDVFGNITIRAADDTSPDTVRVFSQDTDGVLRLREDGVHLEGFTLVCRSSGEWALTVREDLEVQGSETGGHLIERMIMVATRPENVGSNSISQSIQSLGPDTIVRNNHIWGYFEGTLDLRFATNSVFSHNTMLFYQGAGDPLIDATQVQGLEISNNAVAPLARSVGALVGADDNTADLLVVGNVTENVGTVLGGLEITDPGVTVADNDPGPLPMESPRSPRVLSDSTLQASAMGTAAGTSFDGVDLESATDRVPGAYQTRSVLGTPRRTVVSLGEVTCGGEPCDLSQTFDNELQRAVWTAWPGAAVEIYPSAVPYSGPAVISWPIEVRGVGAQPEDVIIRRVIEDGQLADDGLWYGKSVVLDLTRGMGAPTVVEMLTVEAGENQVGIYHEGSNGVGLASRHEIRRVILNDDDALRDDIAEAAILVGDDVVVHDVLVYGGYDTCVRFGPRSSSSSSTPSVAAYVHNLTCRLTEPGSLSGFEVASVDGVVIANAAVELLEPGPLFRAQRRSSNDDDPLLAADLPVEFTASAISALGYDTLYDGFTDMEGTYTLTGVETPMEPLFVSPTDSHLAVGSTAIDTGVDPVTLDLELSLGVSVDGIDRSLVLLPDRGAYEQGM